MDLDAATAFLRDNHRSVLATRRRDGSPQLSPVVHAVDDEGRVMISTREPAMKVKNLRRDPRAALCAVNDGFFGDWVQVNGAVEVIALPEAMDLLVATYRQIAGEHDDWDDYRQAMVRDKRVILRLTVESAGPDRRG
jgi:PPOX class probable F420-dependent enzyme